jgi:putative membrane protein
MSWLSLLVPWQPSPTVVAVTLLFAVLYWRGGQRRRVSRSRRLLFWTGLGLLYVALHTRVDYFAEREFFVHRLQHMVLHHLGPFLIALAVPGPVIRSGLPPAWRARFLHPIETSRLFRASLGFVMQPVIAGALFVGLIWVWLVPGIHFYAMLDVRLYRLMNWSMTIDGLFFWFLVLDRRPSPPARMRPGSRIFLLAAVIPLQMLPGALITFASFQIYPLYALCGRAFAGITAQADQTLGGLILWIPSSMMSVLGALIAMYFWFDLSDRRNGKSGR